LEYSQVARLPFLVRAFKGSNPFIPFGEYSSVGRASGCGSERHGFNSRYSPLSISGNSAVGSVSVLGTVGQGFKSLFLV
jgi:hypothetical protein